MNFFEWGCLIPPFVRFIAGILNLSFIVVCFLIIVELGYRVFKGGKILFSLIGFLILVLVVIPVVKIIPDLFIEQYVNIESNYLLLTFSEIHINIWLKSGIVISYIHCKVCQYICNVKKLSKKVIYALYGSLFVILAVLSLILFNFYDYIVEKNNFFNECWWIDL